MAHKILAIDDHPETLSIIVATLREHGYRVISSRSPFKGLQLAEAEKPDLLLVDMNMPDMNGIEVVRQVRANNYLSRMPIVMFTAESDAIQKMEGFQAGVDDYIIKPTDPIELIERVATLLENTPDPDPENKFSQSLGGAHILTAQREDKKPEIAVKPEAEGQLIVLVGARGGVGTTTVAINLAYVIAAAGCDTILADFDLRQGHVGLYLNQADKQGINNLAGMATTHLNEALPRQLIPYRPNLRLLLARPNMNGRHPLPTAAQLVTSLEMMLGSGQHVIADLGLGATDITQPVLDRAEHVVVCLSPERVGLAATKRYLDDLKDALFFSTSVHVLLCDISSGVNLPPQAVEKYLGHPLLGVLPIQRKELMQASNKGLALAQIFTQSSTVPALQKMARQFVPAQK